MYDVYKYAKRETLSAWSRPSRKLARHATESCPDNGTELFNPYHPIVEQMQYWSTCLKYAILLNVAKMIL